MVLVTASFGEFSENFPGRSALGFRLGLGSPECWGGTNCSAVQSIVWALRKAKSNLVRRAYNNPVPVHIVLVLLEHPLPVASHPAPNYAIASQLECSATCTMQHVNVWPRIPLTAVFNPPRHICLSDARLVLYCICFCSTPS